jgi:hypothetical protein
MSQLDSVSPQFSEFFNKLTSEQRDGLVTVLRDPRTFLAEDLDDVIAILRQLDS